MLHRLGARRPVALYGLSLSIARSDALAVGFLSRLRNLADEIGARWVSDHLSWTGIDGMQTDDCSQWH